MKKIYLSLSAVLFAGALAAQSQRLVVVEEFTQASCPPCATQNPAFNTLLNANPTKVVAIKMQTSWPGADPMNAQNPTEVQNRVDYYSVNGVPDALLDAVEQTGASYLGAPANFTQAAIDAQYAVPSPFTMVLTHSFSPAYDSINVTCTITASQAVSGTLVARIAIIERDIYFTSAPGTNGETHFEGVMKKMLPDAEGTSLAATWITGDTQTLNFSIPVPSYTYDLNQIAVVGFVQDDANKEMLQGGYSAPIGGIPTTNDAGISAASGYTFLNCSTSITPSITVKNFASAPLTSCNINVSVDNGPATTQAWTGSLNMNQTAVVALSAIPLTGGNHTLRFFTSNPNNAVDYKPFNNSKIATIDVISSYVAAPVNEDFQSATFPSADWAINNPNSDYTFQKYDGFGGFAVGASESSVLLEFYNISAGRFDELYLPGVGLVASPAANLTFDVAYCQYAAENDKLEVLVSTNCGTTWTSAYSKQGAALKTAPPQTGGFAPNATQWRTETASLSTFAGQNVIIKFKGTSQYGNNLWIDNINLTYVTGIADLNGEYLTLSPNPSSNGIFNVDAKFNKSQSLKVSVTDLLGNTVSSFEKAKSPAQNFTIDLSSQSNGTYFVRFENENGTKVQKVNIIK